jgi:hypothetical protein
MNQDQITTVVFDLVIAVIVFGLPWRLLALARRKIWPKAGGWSRWTGFALGLAVWLVVVYGAFVEPRLLVVRRHEIDLHSAGASDSGRQLTVAYVSDTHFGFYKGKGWAERLVTRVNSLSPDAVVFGGDFVSDEAGLAVLPALREIKAPLGKYAVLGNWDYHIGAVDVRQTLGSQGVKTLVNRAADMDGLWLVGVDDLIFGSPDWGKARAGVPEGAPWVAAVHEPVGAAWASHFGAGLALAGHTHGGQVRLPLVGSVSFFDPGWLGRAYDWGLLRFDGVPLLVSAGVGESGPRARLLVPPEIVLVTIRY